MVSKQRIRAYQSENSAMLTKCFLGYMSKVGWVGFACALKHVRYFSP